MSTSSARIWLLHAAVLLALLLAQPLLPEYHYVNVARILVLACYAVGYNVLLGYTGLMSLGHAMFFALGMYGAGLPVYYHGVGALPALALGVAASALGAALFGLIALRTRGVAFLIVTMMFGQAFHLTLLHFNVYTLGDQGFILSETIRTLDVAGAAFDLADSRVKYNAALGVFSVCLLASLLLVRSPVGRVLVAIRENEDRTRLLGYNTYLARLLALTVSGTIAGAAGATYALLFSYVGASFASILHSIYPLLWTLLGGAGTTLGPLLGTGLMFYLEIYARDLTTAYLVVVGAVLLVLVLWAPRGILGTLRDRKARWLP
ncbi:MAG: branched-chain amino acid ABC transporter permease [Ectothiorhodospiraceae bacterium]|nr:branched-chain amino acid ABC transporter permease [Ectothiorhodospiraceae bacterium]